MLCSIEEPMKDFRTGKFQNTAQYWTLHAKSTFKMFCFVCCFCLEGSEDIPGIILEVAFQGELFLEKYYQTCCLKFNQSKPTSFVRNYIISIIDRSSSDCHTIVVISNNSCLS